MIDTLILYIIGGLTGLLAKGSMPATVLLLVGLIMASLICIADNCNFKYFENYLYSVLSLVIVFVPELSPFTAVIVYGIFHRKKTELLIDIPVALFICTAFVRYYKSYGLAAFGVALSLVIVAALLGIKQYYNEYYESSLKKLRDDSTEKNRLLSEKNKSLEKEMENEIEIATLSERNRIAREIHDNVGHMLSRAILQLGAIMTVNKSNAQVYKQLEPLKDSLDTAMNNIRESVHDLHKDSFDVKKTAEGILEELTDFDVKFNCDMTVDADKNVKYAFITILKEAVTNIVKYCNGDNVKVNISELDEHYQMLIEDNGTNIKAIDHYEEGIGLNNMRTRIKSLNGIINFNTEKGFRIFISVPKRKGTQ